MYLIYASSAVSPSDPGAPVAPFRVASGLPKLDDHQVDLEQLNCNEDEDNLI